MKIFSRLFRVVSLCFKVLEDIFSGIISTALSAVITLAVVGGLVIVALFVLKTVSSMLAGNF